jgi:5-methylcytosine-specific restriction endonuclease McrA
MAICRSRAPGSTGVVAHGDLAHRAVVVTLMPARPPKQCPQAGCPELTTGGYCPTHVRPAWQGSHHRNDLPSDWTRRRQRILRRDGYRCQWRERVDGQLSSCAARATDVDAIVPTTAGGSHTDDANLQSLCHQHHLRKSAREGRAAQLDSR